MARDEDALASARIVAALTRRGLSLAVAESLTGGLLVSAIVDTPGASAVLRGGVVAYDTRAKASVLGVDADLLARVGAVDPDVALEMAEGVRRVFALGSSPADIGIATTGVAGPEPQDGHPVGTVFVAWVVGDRREVRRLELSGERSQIRSDVVSESLRELVGLVEGFGE
jgi:nicotinamide-nucleotide amidase